MKIRAKTLITKGVLGLRKAWALATKGVLDQLPRGAQPSLTEKDVIYTFILKGKKEFEKDVELTFKGKKSYTLDKDLELVGKLLKEIESNYRISGKKQFEDKFKVFIIARRQIEILEQFQLEARKLIGIKLDREIHGAIQKDIEHVLNISSKKAINEKTVCGIKGGKELHLAKTQLITGKKDLTPIFLALDDD